MAASIFDQIKALATPETVERISGGIGETPHATERALTGAAIPAVLGGLVQQFSGGAGPARLMSLVRQHDPDGRLLDSVHAGAPGQAAGALQNTGQGLMGTLFGQRSDHVANAVAEHAGIKKTSAVALLPMAGTLVVGFLGQRVVRGGLDAGGLGSMLTGMRGELGRIAPPGLAQAVGVSSLAEPAGTYAASATASPRDTVYREREAPTVRHERAGMPSWLPWLIAALLIAAALWLWRSTRTPRIQVPHPTVQAPHVPTTPTAPQVTHPAVTPPTPPAAEAPTAQAPAQAPAMQAPPVQAPAVQAPSAQMNLPNGAQLNIPRNSVAYGLANYLGATNAPAPPQRFTFTHLRFPTGQSTLTSGSAVVLNDVAQILRAYPNTRVRVEGFTDNMGGPQINMTLSANRAQAVRAALTDRGVEPNRIEVVGFGPNHPIANNATPTGRAMNRRTDLVVLNR